MADKNPYPPPEGSAPPPPPEYSAPPPPYNNPGQGGAYGGPPIAYPGQMQYHPVPESSAGAAASLSKEPKKTSLFGSLLKEVDKVASTVTNEINVVVGQHTTSAILNQFQTGNVLQLVSRTSGRCLQIVQAVNGQLVVDGAGQAKGDPPFNTLWTIVNEGKNQVRLHNNNNFLTIVNGQTALISVPPGSVHGIETKLQLHLIQNQFVLLESIKEHGKYIGILQDGSLKPAASTGREANSHFILIVVYSPYVSVPPAGSPK